MIDEPRREYLETFFTFETPMLGLPARFAVVTAWNPHGENASIASNRAADERLHEELTRSGRAPFRVTGGSVNAAHVEPGWGFACSSPEDARGFSGRYKQVAFYWVDDAELYVINTDGRRRHRVAAWAARVRM